MPKQHRKSTTARGLGWTHQQNATRLRRRHIDGTPCWWCNRPMYLERERNFDGQPLGADHSTARSRGGHTADRLLHQTCNSQRGDGSRDHQRPALTGHTPQPAGPTDIGHLAIDCWPD
ncbi:hypothetical protein ACIGKQ_16475 [Gordonia sp. NPDC062954]|uniref:hypothetical protein n=1 Tax=Gordonia sp. NPDC062954 TaxID=3364003 RepID=UPI0037CA134D